MADLRRRSMMPPPPDTYGAGRSGIPQPVPSTIKKPTANMRMSLTGPALRAPYQTPGPSHNPRQSMMRSQNANPLLQSTTKPNYGRTPLNSSTRHGSLWAAGGNVAPSGSQTLKDTRPLRDRQYQTKMRQEILSYLQGSGFDISMASLANITGKDFRAIFDFLVLTLDPSHPLGQNTRFEDEFVPALKALRYPFAHQIDNKWLAAPASMHSWPSLLGALHWLVEMCKLRDDYFNSGHPTLQNPVDIPEEFDDPFDHRALAFDYFDQAYTVWLDLIDDFIEPNRYLEDRYTRKNQSVQKDLEELTKKLDHAKAELHKLQSSSAPVSKLQNENGLLTADSEKFQKILQQYEGRKKKLIDTIAYEKAELGTGAAHLEQLKQEHARLSEVVKEQNLTPEEVIRMNTDHEMLSRNLEDLKLKIAETHKVVMTLEVTVTNRAEAAEEALDAYTNLLSSLELLPPLPPFQDVDLTLELNTATSNPQLLLLGADIRKVIKPTLSSVAESKRAERASLESERIKVDNELDQLTLECENVEEEIGELERKVVALGEQAEDLREAAQREANVASAEAARLERELAHARTAALASGMGVKSRLQALQFDYNEKMEKISRLKEETVRAIIKNSHDIAMFKEEVSRHLRELREFAEGD
ncbi:putative kinetochore protein NDC80 [Termitomyces sp. T112]|nr:putative kinetochore protein NDC80 [Termitomyces sp. T112]